MANQALMRRDLNQYRIYFLDVLPDQPSVVPFESPSDSEAYAAAKERAGVRPFELWTGDRLVIQKNR